MPFSHLSDFANRRYLVFAAVEEQLTNAKIHVIEAARVARETNRILVLPKGSHSHLSLGRSMPMCAYCDLAYLNATEWVSPEFFLLLARAAFVKPTVSYLCVDTPELGRPCFGTTEIAGSLGAVFTLAMGHVPTGGNTIWLHMPARFDQIQSLLNAWKHRDVMIDAKNTSEHITTNHNPIFSFPYRPPPPRKHWDVVVMYPKSTYMEGSARGRRHGAHHPFTHLPTTIQALIYIHPTGEAPTGEAQGRGVVVYAKNTYERSTGTWWWYTPRTHSSIEAPQNSTPLSGKHRDVVVVVYAKNTYKRSVCKTGDKEHALLPSAHEWPGLSSLEAPQKLKHRDVVIYAKNTYERFDRETDDMAHVLLPYAREWHLAAKRIVARLPKPFIGVHYRSEFIAFRLVCCPFFAAEALSVRRAT
ncbi:unnamed protein product [Closterium sp. NIES-65]|nr:unnamed protein product [Closterium sp. NIES-65]